MGRASRNRFMPGDDYVKRGTASHLVLLETFDLEESMFHEQGTARLV
jgi:hypothetical protein